MKLSGFGRWRRHKIPCRNLNMHYLTKEQELNFEEKYIKYMGQPPELNCITQKFRFIYENLCKKDFIKPDFIKSYNSASRNSLHRILQYVLIKAGIGCGYISIPEYKVRLEKPIDKSKIDLKKKEKIKEAETTQCRCSVL